MDRRGTMNIIAGIVVSMIIIANAAHAVKPEKIIKQSNPHYSFQILAGKKVCFVKPIICSSTYQTNDDDNPTEHFETDTRNAMYLELSRQVRILNNGWSEASAEISDMISGHYLSQCDSITEAIPRHIIDALRDQGFDAVIILHNVNTNTELSFGISPSVGYGMSTFMIGPGLSFGNSDTPVSKLSICCTILSISENKPLIAFRLNSKALPNEIIDKSLEIIFSVITYMPDTGKKKRG